MDSNILMLRLNELSYYVKPHKRTKPIKENIKCKFCGSTDVKHSPAYVNGNYLCIDCEMAVYEEVKDFIITDAERINHTGWIECGECKGSVGLSGKYCKHCGAKFTEVQDDK